jgi:hypothetical protein
MNWTWRKRAGQSIREAPPPVGRYLDPMPRERDR